MKSTVALVALCAALAGCPASEPPKPDHVLLIVVDTLRADHLGVMGYTRPTSPNIDALARGGVLFRRAFSQASFTSPSMVSLMTGRYIAKERLDIPGDLSTLAESFMRAGFATAGFSSNALVSPQNGFGRGFERFETLPVYGSNDAIAQWMASVADKRSFTYVHINEPHDPYLAPEGRREWRTAKDFLPGDRASYLPRIARELGLTEVERGIDAIKEEIGGYDDDVRYADGRVAELLELFEASGLRARGVIAVTADHGEGLWEKVALMNGQRGAARRRGDPPNLLNTLMPTHGNQVHRELVHVPLLLDGLGVPDGRIVDSVVENVDLFPTLLELADIAGPGGLHGTSLLRHFDGSSPAKDVAFSFTRFNTSVIDADGWQLISPTPEGECAEDIQLELFDLNSDPNARTNLAGEHLERVAKMRGVAEQRMRIAIHAAGGFSSEDEAAIAALGYAEWLRQENPLLAEVAQLETAVLLAHLTNFATPCTDRLSVARELARRTLDDGVRAELRKWLASETSRTVREALEPLTK
ncbi:MAG: sulfatase [Planctomycetes bacterium]|nr:sulfatase [Planctomycetota bacterium]